MKWDKKGFIFKVNGNYGWMNTHAQVPVMLIKEKEKILRVYFSTRETSDQSQTTFLDLDLYNLNDILYIHDSPILNLGRPGTFDEHGIMPSSIVEFEGIVYLYYSGWQRSVGVPYNNYTGLAISKDGGQIFTKYSEAPVLDRNNIELFSATSPCVIKEENGWHMWYCSGVNWHMIGEKFEHTYNIKYAKSEDGKNWNQTGITCIQQNNEFEAITKPAVIKVNGTYHMWFCYRGSNDFRNGKDAYRIGYATSLDKVNWERKDEDSGISPSNEGWDSKMIAYPEIKKIEESIVMLYNGNSFGKEGIGWAILKMDHV